MLTQFNNRISVLMGIVWLLLCVLPPAALCGTRPAKQPAIAANRYAQAVPTTAKQPMMCCCCKKGHGGKMMCCMMKAGRSSCNMGTPQTMMCGCGRTRRAGDIILSWPVAMPTQTARLRLPVPPSHPLTAALFTIVFRYPYPSFKPPQTV